MVRGGYLVLVMCQGRIESDGLPKNLDCLSMIIQFLVSLAQLKVRIRIVGLYAGSLLQKGNTQVPLSLKIVDHTQIVVGKVLFRIGSHLNLELFQGFAGLALALIEKIGDAKIIVGAWKASIKCNGLLKLLYRVRHETSLS